MSRMNRKEAHLMVAAIRVLEDRELRPPTPLEVADLVNQSESAVRLQLYSLGEMGVVKLVESAYEVHVEVKDHLLIEDLSTEAGPDISEDLAAFDRKKEEEAERMAHLFDSGEFEENKQKQLSRMDRDLKEFKGKKPVNPFGED